MCKRGVSGAFNLLYLRPDMWSALATDFPSGESNFNSDITMSPLAHPFGWLTGPSFYQLFAESVTLHHADIGPINPERNGIDTFRQFTFVGDSMFIASRICNWPELNADCWEFCLKRRERQARPRGYVAHRCYSSWILVSRCI